MLRRTGATAIRCTVGVRTLSFGAQMDSKSCYAAPTCLTPPGLGTTTRFCSTANTSSNLDDDDDDELNVFDSNASLQQDFAQKAGAANVVPPPPPPAAPSQMTGIATAEDDDDFGASDIVEDVNQEQPLDEAEAGLEEDDDELGADVDDATAPAEASSSAEETKIPKKYDSKPALLFFKSRPLEGPLCGALIDRLRETNGSGVNEEGIMKLLDEVRTDADLLKVIEHCMLKHHLMLDPLDGKGFRVSKLGKLTSMQNFKVGTPKIWLEAIAICRQLGFQITRSYVTSFIAGLKTWQRKMFHDYGRKPEIIEFTCDAVEEVLAICRADGVTFDHVFYARLVNVISTAISCFDRQNMYRANFGSHEKGDHPKRDGLVLDWVIGEKRHWDYDYAVTLGNRSIKLLLKHLSSNTNANLTCSLVSRLADYYYATDNPDDFLSLMNFVSKTNLVVGEDVTSKLLQLVLAFNFPEAPKLFIKWRIQHELSTVSLQDIYRLLMYYTKSGGGNPCPKCGDQYNHRNPSLTHWHSLHHHQRYCDLHMMAYSNKGVLDDTEGLPQSKDWSTQAFALYELSEKRNLRWTEGEWRAFLQCFMFSPKAQALKAIRLVREQLEFQYWDEFLKHTYVRLLSHHEPEMIGPTFNEWETARSSNAGTPMLVSLMLIGVSNVEDFSQRNPVLHELKSCIIRRRWHVMPYTKRYMKGKWLNRWRDFQRQREELSARKKPWKLREGFEKMNERNPKKATSAAGGPLPSTSAVGKKDDAEAEKEGDAKAKEEKQLHVSEEELNRLEVELLRDKDLIDVLIAQKSESDRGFKDSPADLIQLSTPKHRTYRAQCADQDLLKTLPLFPPTAKQLPDASWVDGIANAGDGAEVALAASTRQSMPSRDDAPRLSEDERLLEEDG